MPWFTGPSLPNNGRLYPVRGITGLNNGSKNTPISNIRLPLDPQINTGLGSWDSTQPRYRVTTQTFSQLPLATPVSEITMPVPGITFNAPVSAPGITFNAPVSAPVTVPSNARIQSTCGSENSKLTASEKAGYAASYLFNNLRTLDLSYGSKIHCYLLYRLNKLIDLTNKKNNSAIPKSFGTPIGENRIFLDHIRSLFPAATQDLSQIKTINLTGQHLKQMDLLKFIQEIYRLYPTLIPGRIIINGNDNDFNNPKFLEHIQTEIQNMYKNTSVRLNLTSGGSRKTRRRRRLSRKRNN